MMFTGIIEKMKTAHNEVVLCNLKSNNSEIEMNSLIGKHIQIRFSGKIKCLGCGRETHYSYHQGYCFVCEKTLPETAPCILNPELCEAHLGYWRNKAWSEQNCLQAHYVYLADTGNLKVGVTRKTQIPTRWIDQGAARALTVLETANRHEAGVIEVFLKNFYSDKTVWQNMLKTQNPVIENLQSEKEAVLNKLRNTQFQFQVTQSDVVSIQYPLEKAPEKVTAFNIEKESEISGKLSGIKGQYLIFEDGKVLNVRKHGGYEYTLDF